MCVPFNGRGPWGPKVDTNFLPGPTNDSCHSINLKATGLSGIRSFGNWFECKRCYTYTHPH